MIKLHFHISIYLFIDLIFLGLRCISILVVLFQFLDECISCFAKSDDESRNLCLNYMAPWLPNLARFSACVKTDPNKIKMIDIIDKLIKLTISNREVKVTLSVSSI